MLLFSSLLLCISMLHAQFEEDFTPNPTGWILSQGASFGTVNGNNVIVTPGVGGNNPAVIGTPIVNKTSNTVKVCLDIFAYKANLNEQLPFECLTLMDVLFVKSSVLTANEAELPANILARVDNHPIPIAGGNTCFTFTFPPSVVDAEFKVFLSFHAPCNQSGVKYVLDNVSISGVDDVCSAPATCGPTALNDDFIRGNATELSFNAVLFGTSYPVPPGFTPDVVGLDNDQNDTYSHLRWSLVTPPANGVVVVNADGTAIITRNNLAITQLTFTYQLCDDGVDNIAGNGDDLCDQATVTAHFSVGTVTPIGLINYSASRNGSHVTLKWTTTHENNNKGFELQRSIANGNFETIAFIASKAKDGNSAVSLSYDYRDNNATSQTSMYRLVQSDIDGTRKIHGIKVVNGQSSTNKLQVYPNPSINGQVRLGFGNTNEKNISIVTLQGKVVKIWNAFRNDSLVVTNLESGIYVLSVVDKTTGEKRTEKIMVIK